MIVDVERVGHGGICVARAPDGRVVFVRHALPGERVRVQVTDQRASYYRGDAVEILRPSTARVAAPCPYARPGRCGGCDWQHATLTEQRRLKAAVVREQLVRLARIDRDVVVEPAPVNLDGNGDGLGWRTRMRFAVDASGRAGLHRHRSHEVEPIDDCLIAHPAVRAAEVLGQPWPGAQAVDVEASASGGRLLTVTPPGPAAGQALTQRAAGRAWTVPAGGFWQVHPAAADVLVDAVAAAVCPSVGERCLDLYAGVGLFSDLLCRSAGPGAVVAVESDPRAAAAAADNVPGVEVVVARVERWLPGNVGRFTVVVIDPPRRGAGRQVCEAIVMCEPRVVVYVACDPASLARDVATRHDGGYEVTSLRAFDLFPMTAHVECVAVLERRQ